METVESLPSFLRTRLIRTFTLFLTWICMGMFLEIIGPTLQDLKDRTNSEYESLSQAVSGRSIGAVSGSIIGGILIDKQGQYCDLIIGLCLMAAAAATIAVPLSNKVLLTGALIMVTGLAELIVNVAGNTTILYLWREKASPPMHMLHLGFGIGCLLVPLVANPFLPLMTYLPDCDVSTSSNISLTNVTDTNCSINSIESTMVLEDSMIEYAYALVAIPTVVLAMVFMVFQCIFPQVHDVRGTKIKKRDSKAMLNPGSCTDGDWWYGLLLFSLVFLYFLFTVGFERFYTKFIRTFAVDELNFTKDEGSYINTGFWVTFSLGRLIGFATGKFVSIRIMMVCEISGVCLSALGLNLVTVFNFEPEASFWIFSLLIGLFLGPMWPTGIYWTDYHVELTGMGITVICLAGGCGGFSCVSIMGYLYDAIGHVCFVYEAMVCGLLVFVIGLCLNFVGIRHGSRFDKVKDEQIITVEDIDNKM
ncbi:sodium-dependent glucose transporter 1A-like [Mizuhopecten yessoensis]|uniref:Sodium-dependent glucose transporter 1A n=1 Tax=Mizuhopecten yessoensis TaxID=6573 RepID=A0A210Q7Y8_MIZYE|nr:sodium-dependent glucose transporter 1A-like [Mizuhopecten yessoensis]OWF44844.1 Sodium-dependent glucose transporter 1A [Mizuhopecten yessoensis]